MENLDKQKDAEDLSAWLEYKSANPSLLDANNKKVSLVNKVLRSKLENESPQLAREQLSSIDYVVTDMMILSAKSEKQYRDAQKVAAKNCPVSLKSDSRKMWLDGECCDFRYQRDIFAGLHQGLRDKASSVKSILASLNQEMRNNNE